MECEPFHSNALFQHGNLTVDFVAATADSRFKFKVLIVEHTIQQQQHTSGIPQVGSGVCIPYHYHIEIERLKTLAEHTVFFVIVGLKYNVC